MFRRKTINPRSNSRAISAEAGLTLIELIITCAILLVLTSAALPVAKFTVIRQRETELRHALRQIRDAIDSYRDATDHNYIRVEIGSEGYPPDLETLTKPLALSNNADRKIRFMREIPIDPMTGKADWGLRAVGDDPDSQHWGGKNVFDVYSRSTGTALDGTKYLDW